MANLYDLPKDMLIKLITTIEQNTIEKYEKKLVYAETRYKIIEKMALRVTIFECEKCSGIMVSSDYGCDNEYLNCDCIDACNKCGYDYCDQHLHEHDCKPYKND